MRQFLVLALVVVAGMSTTVVAQEGTVRKLTPAEQAQLDTDNKGRATAMTAAQWLARRSGGNFSHVRNYGSRDEGTRSGVT